MSRLDLGYPVESFRFSLRPFVQIGLWMGAAVGAYLLVTVLVRDWDALVPAKIAEASGVALLMVFGGCALMTLSGVAISAIWTIKVGPRGLAGWNAFGWPVQATWGEIESVDEVSVQGIPYMVCQLKNRKSRLWMPLDIADGEHFDALVASYIPLANPLAEWVAVVPEAEQV